jgi:hypothetical protein
VDPTLAGQRDYRSPTQQVLDASGGSDKTAIARPIGHNDAAPAHQPISRTPAHLLLLWPKEVHPRLPRNGGEHIEGVRPALMRETENVRARRQTIRPLHANSGVETRHYPQEGVNTAIATQRAGRNLLVDRRAPDGWNLALPGMNSFSENEIRQTYGHAASMPIWQS